MFADNIADFAERFVAKKFGRQDDFSGGRGGFGRGFMGDGGIPGGRRLSSSDLQLLILSLLEEAPAHGYEVIQILEERSGGFYSPSPGMVYPALTALQDAGYASVAQKANRKLYSITTSGREYIETHRERATSIFDMLQRIGRRMAEVREAYAGIDDIDPESADAFSAARDSLKRVLLTKRGWSPDQKLRIAAILRRATEDISNI